MRVYFDGLCVLCSTEINHYRRRQGSEKIQFVDITATNFDAAAEGLDPFLVHKVMHVKNEQGQLITGVDAFIEIWNQLPAYRFLAKLARRQPIRSLLNLGYHGFVVIRPYLPRRKEACADSPYCEIKKERA